MYLRYLKLLKFIILLLMASAFLSYLAMSIALLIVGEWIIFAVGIAVYFLSKHMFFPYVVWSNVHKITPLDIPDNNNDDELLSLMTFLGIMFIILIMSVWSIAVIFGLISMANPNSTYYVCFFAYGIAGCCLMIQFSLETPVQFLTMYPSFLIACLTSALSMVIWDASLIGVILVYGIVFIANMVMLSIFITHGLRDGFEDEIQLIMPNIDNVKDN